MSGLRRALNCTPIMLSLLFFFCFFLLLLFFRSGDIQLLFPVVLMFQYLRHPGENTAKIWPTEWLKHARKHAAGAFVDGASDAAPWRHLDEAECEQKAVQHGQLSIILYQYSASD